MFINELVYIVPLISNSFISIDISSTSLLVACHEVTSAVAIAILQPHRPEELKEDQEAVKSLRKLLARYAEAFPDARAAYALILWDQGDRIEAEPWMWEYWDLGWHGWKMLEVHVNVVKYIGLDVETT